MPIPQRKDPHVTPRLPRPATVLAFAALVIALTGSAIAAKRYLITSTRQIKPGVLAQLKGKTGPAGPKGDAGATGAKGDTGAAGAKGDTGAAGTNGTDGTNGTNGSDATGATMGALSSTGSGGTTTMLVTTSANAPVTNTGGQLTPNRALVFKDFAFAVPALTGSETITATIVLNGVDSGVACTVTAPATMCTSSATLNVPARSLLAIRVAAGVLGASRGTTWSWTFA